MSFRASIVFAALAFAGSTACKSTNTTPMQPTSLTATFTEALSPANEAPSATGPETSGSGTATITLIYLQDTSGNVTTATASFQVSLTGFPSTTSFTMAHIHQAPAGVSGSIVVNTGLASGTVTLTNGVGSFSISAVNVPAAIAQQLLTNPSAFYFNVHTVANPSGVARGQLVRTQ